MPDDKPKLISRFEPWLKLIITGSAAVAVLWGALMLFNPIGNVDLTVRIEREIPVSLPSEIESLPIRLVYEGRNITRASIVQVEILNSGSMPIGGPAQPEQSGRRWKIDLRNSEGVDVVPLGAPRSKPPNLEVDLVEGTARNIVSLVVGLFNPGDSILLELMLVEPNDTMALPIVAETRIAGLAEPVTGRRNVQDRLRDAFVGPLWISVFLGLLGLIMYERLQLVRAGKELALAHTIVGGVLLSLLFSAMVAFGGAWVIAWFAAKILTH